MAPIAPKDWYRSDFLISTSHTLLQPDTINQFFGTDAMYWTSPLPEDPLKKMLDNSLCFGLYALPQSSAEIAGRTNPKQIGLARLITDEVSFAYLTDVYVQPEYQGKGLGKWLIGCVDEVLMSWPHLRRAMLVTSNGGRFYKEVMGMKQFESGIEVFSKKGAGSVLDE
ncbi:hypothetical protein BP6252_06238 [Coleophoma cylindrospora]|uniref:N-acetyltransferase domain-containing protein n=1 Tax=Coleophoma cylindrospora TaxID=1849047 RepID=A0A3D8RMD3_9HELO|nr:hypothetical protein BP6252_06238 [Coleophoma cylindrospora]